jgi:hypothetical protein
MAQRGCSSSVYLQIDFDAGEQRSLVYGNSFFRESFYREPRGALAKWKIQSTSFVSGSALKS